ncbi:MAG: hypothetical protein LBV69_07090 [Bacteroidales bacterium]|nr:hypothetical protein [Bacteroidales bacterium]
MKKIQEIVNFENLSLNDLFEIRGGLTQNSQSICTSSGCKSGACTSKSCENAACTVKACKSKACDNSACASSACNSKACKKSENKDNK